MPLSKEKRPNKLNTANRANFNKKRPKEVRGFPPPIVDPVGDARIPEPVSEFSLQVQNAECIPPVQLGG